jgi:aryl-alcohol dehydrogenase-like predicted oxidoreductase
VLTRKLAGRDVPAIGLGCMNLSHAYGTPPAPADAGKVLERALELGITHFDTVSGPRYPRATRAEIDTGTEEYPDRLPIWAVPS